MVLMVIARLMVNWMIGIWLCGVRIRVGRCVEGVFELQGI